MDQQGRQVVSYHPIEIIPPKRDNRSARDTVTCLCCQKKRPATSMDSDSCGICVECLAA